MQNALLRGFTAWRQYRRAGQNADLHAGLHGGIDAGLARLPMCRAAIIMLATLCVVAGAQAPGSRGSVRCPPSKVRAHPEIWGFTAPWDPRSAASIACNGAALSVVVSGWMRLDTLTALPTPVYPDAVHRPSGPRRFVLVTTYQRDRFHRETIARLGADRALLGRVAGTLARAAAAKGYRGLVLDFEALARNDTTALSTVVRAIADSAHKHHIAPVAVAVVAMDTIVYANRRLRAADVLLLMLYDQHWATGTPGPIASPDWVRQALATRVAEAGAGRIVASLPTYGYLWKAPAAAAVLSFGDAERQARSLGISLARDSASATLHFVRPDSGEGWVTDAYLLRMLEHEAESVGVHRFALWRLGLEDPAIWGAP